MLRDAKVAGSIPARTIYCSFDDVIHHENSTQKVMVYRSTVQRCTMNRYSVTLYITYRHTYEPEELWDEEDCPLPCGRTGCKCSKYDEPPLTEAEVDAFMQELKWDSAPRYKWYIASVLPYDKTVDVTYEPGGKITFCVETTMDTDELTEKLATFREVFYDSGPGSEAVVPTVHEHPYIVGLSLDISYAVDERGRIDIDLDRGFVIVPLNGETP